MILGLTVARKPLVGTDTGKAPRLGDPNPIHSREWLGRTPVDTGKTAGATAVGVGAGSSNEAEMWALPLHRRAVGERAIGENDIGWESRQRWMLVQSRWAWGSRKGSRWEAVAIKVWLSGQESSGDASYTPHMTLVP